MFTSLSPYSQELHYTIRLDAHLWPLQLQLTLLRDWVTAHTVYLVCMFNRLIPATATATDSLLIFLAPASHLWYLSGEFPHIARLILLQRSKWNQPLWDWQKKLDQEFKAIHSGVEISLQHCQLQYMNLLWNLALAERDPFSTKQNHYFAGVQLVWQFFPTSIEYEVSHSELTSNWSTIGNNVKNCICTSDCSQPHMIAWWLTLTVIIY